MDNNELTHHGIKGMRWGVRRTPAQLGRSSPKRAVKKTGFLGQMKKKKQAAKAAEEAKKKKLTAEETAKKKAHVLKTKSAKELYKHKDLFTDQELQSAYNRLMLERNVKSLSANEISEGERFVNNTIKWTTKAATVLDSGTKLYNNSAKIYNSLTDKGRKNPLPIIDAGKKKKKKKDDDDE